MMKILHLNNYISYTSGVTRYIYHIIKNTNSIFEHEIICLGGDAEELFKEQNVKVTVLNRFGLFSLPGIYFFLLKYCKHNQFDIIHNHHRIFDTVTSLIPRRNFKTLTSVHSKVYGRKLFSYKANYLISYSDSITNHLIEYFKKSPSKISRMKSFVDRSNVKIIVEKDELKKHLSITGNKVIMFIGRFSKEKGVDILVKAFNELYDRNKKISLIMIGEGEEEQSLKNYCSENKLPVQFLTPRTNIFDYYNVADIIVLPSRVDPFPYVMLESGLMNKPFIGSNVDGIAELIKHRVNGLLFESENINELTKCIQMILEDQTLAKKISQNLHHDVVENYTLEKVISEYVKLYTSITSGNKIR
jgi:glycosyltransferase involved in cell wall biosynthesis